MFNFLKRFYYRHAKLKTVLKAMPEEFVLQTKLPSAYIQGWELERFDFLTDFRSGVMYITPEYTSMDEATGEVTPKIKTMIALTKRVEV